MTLRQLEVFLAIARAQGYRRAAEALHTSQPALSQHIRELERELGARLFDRLGHLAERPHRRQENRQHGQRHSDRADPDREAQADPRGEGAAQQRPERHHAPDDEPDYR